MGKSYINITMIQLNPRLRNLTHNCINKKKQITVIILQVIKNNGVGNFFFFASGVENLVHAYMYLNHMSKLNENSAFICNEGIIEVLDEKC